MCSRPSMPPRSTNAPKSAMFLTSPETICLRLRFSSRRRWRTRVPSMSLRREITMLRVGVDLEDRGADLAADEIADLARAADVDLRAGRNTARRCRRADRPDLLDDTPPTTSPSRVVSCQTPVEHAVGLAAESMDRAGVSSMPSKSTWTLSPTFQVRGVLELRTRSAFRRLLPVDDHVARRETDHAAPDDRVRRERGDLAAEQRVHSRRRRTCATPA